LRALNMLYEIGISGRNHLIFIPTESRGLGIPTPIGVLGIDKLVGIGDTGNVDGQKPSSDSANVAKPPQKPVAQQQASTQQRSKQQATQQQKQKKNQAQQNAPTVNPADNIDSQGEAEGDSFKV
ncbi:MAG: hypothetical protein QW814_02420, partial [Methanothrix sp.]